MFMLIIFLICLINIFVWELFENDCHVIIQFTPFSLECCSNVHTLQKEYQSASTS